MGTARPAGVTQFLKSVTLFTYRNIQDTKSKTKNKVFAGASIAIRDPSGERDNRYRNTMLKGEYVNDVTLSLHSFSACLKVQKTKWPKTACKTVIGHCIRSILEFVHPGGSGRAAHVVMRRGITIFKCGPFVNITVAISLGI